MLCKCSSCGASLMEALIFKDQSQSSDYHCGKNVSHFFLIYAPLKNKNVHQKCEPKIEVRLKLWIEKILNPLNTKL